MKQRGFFDVDERLKRVSDLGDPLEAMAGVIDFEVFRPMLDAALKRSDGSQGGRPAFDPVMMFKVLILQALNDLSDERAEFLITDRLSYMRFLGLALGDKAPDRNTIWTFREALKKAGAIDDLFAAFDRAITHSGYRATHGQIVDASLIAAPKQRLTQEEKAAIKAGKSADEIWDNPHKAAQKDAQARWTIKYSKKKDDAPKGQVDIAIPSFGYKSHVMTDRAHGFIRAFKVTDAARHDGAQLKDIVRTDVMATGVFADTAYRSKANEAWLARHGLVSHIHRRKPKGQPMPENIRRGDRAKSKVRSLVEHVFADLKARMGVKVRTIGLARAKIKIGIANIAYNMRRFVFHRRKAAASA
ncbi:MAG: IS5 family transposase [Parvularculaceae bacterium]|nr:IS5 family transposase [Parvularculaceae bacterium]